MKKKIIVVLVCTLLLTNIFSSLTTAKNLVNIDTSFANSNGDFRVNLHLIKIIDENVNCDLDNDFVVYADSTYLYIYDIKTGETDIVYMGGEINFPKISENIIVFYDFFYMGFKMYDINNGKKTDLIVTNWQGGGTDSFQFFGNYIVYENFYPDLYSTEIFLYNISSGENIQLTESPGEDYSQNPCIYENIVAWQLREGDQNDIVMYNIDSNKYTRVTNTTQFESENYPSIYGNNIVYSYYYNDKNGTIIHGLKMYNFVTGDETTIFEGEESSANSPEIFGNTIVYSRSACLYLYDLNTNDEIKIYESFGLAQPWNLNENYILFTVLGEGVYLYKYNNSPDQPEINGINVGKPGVEYMYCTNVSDPDNDTLFVLWNWGDGSSSDWLGPLESGMEVCDSHSWNKTGTYTISVTLRDDYGASVTAYKEVTIPRNRASYFQWYQLFLELFQLLERLLNLLK